MKTLLRSLDIRISKSDEDWEIVREIFVDSYFNYPLYEHMATNLQTRREFLARYFDANYDVACRKGEAIFICFELVSAEDKDDKRKIVGGMILDPPATNGGGWSLKDDYCYWKAYREHHIHSLYPEAYNRLVSYEKWERTRIAANLFHISVPMWNGMFLAIMSEYTNLGFGRSLKTAICKLMQKLSPQKHATVAEDRKQLSLLRNFQSLSLLSRHSFPPSTAKRIASTENNHIKKVTPPIGIAITHSKRSTGFWQVIIGFQKISQIKYFGEESSSVTVDVLGYDLFNAGTVTHICNLWSQEDKRVVTEMNNNMVAEIFYC